MGDVVIPPFCYLPLCSSIDPFAYILRTLPMECYAFSTKARCPCLMFFEVQVHPDGLDTASFLGGELQEYAEEDIVAPSLEPTRTDFAVMDAAGGSAVTGAGAGTGASDGAEGADDSMPTSPRRLSALLSSLKVCDRFISPPFPSHISIHNNCP